MPGHVQIPTRRDDPVTPELVLVDPTLATQARSVLAEADDTLARMEANVWASRRASLAARSIELPQPGSRPLGARPRRRRHGHRRHAVLAGCAAAGVLVAALLLGVRVDLQGTPAGADTTVVDAQVPSVPPPPTTEDEAPSRPAPRPRTPKAPTKPKPTPQRFAWAPAPGASAYHVELFRGASKVFEADTRGPAVTIPARWELQGRRHRLEPGTYRWYVWPVVSGTRAAKAIVQARLAVPAP